MSSSSVWVQLYYEGKDEPEGQPIKIKPTPDDVGDLAKEVKKEMAEELTHCSAAKLAVYPPATNPLFSKADSMRPGKKLEEVFDELKNTTPPTSDDHPLIVVAPAPARHPHGAPASHPQQPEEKWFKVSGKISRPSTHAGARYKLYQLSVAHGGLYPPDDELMEDKRSAISSALIDATHSVVSFAVVFRDVAQLGLFMNDIGMYLIKNRGQLVLLNDEGNATEEPTVTQIPSFPITPSDIILQTHYKPQDGEAQDGSPLIDMVVDVRSSDITLDVTILSRRDATFQFHRIESISALGLVDPESAHIFPSAKCKGMYEWLDRHEFNRLALSRDVHINFDGTGRGRGKRRRTQQTFAIRPLRPDNGYVTCTHANTQCYKIPLELVLNVNEIANWLMSKLGNDAALHSHDDRHWTIDGSDVAVYHPKGRRVTLQTEKTDDGTLSLVTAIPGVEDLNDCWSNSPTNLYSVEEAEIMERCLMWNHQNALQTWSLV